MYAKTIEYTDYNGNKRKETFYFNFTKAELQDLEFRTPGGIENYMLSITNTLDGQKIADFFKALIQKSYGVKSPDGRRFIKSPEVLDEFIQTEAYSIFYMQLATDDKAAAEFFNGVFPKEAVEAARQQREMAEKAGIELVKPENNTDPFATVPQPAPVVTPAVPKVEGQVDFAPTPLQ